MTLSAPWRARAAGWMTGSAPRSFRAERLGGRAAAGLSTAGRVNGIIVGHLLISPDVLGTHDDQDQLVRAVRACPGAGAEGGTQPGRRWTAHPVNVQPRDWVWSGGSL